MARPTNDAPVNPTTPWPLSIKDQGAAISAAIFKYGVPERVFLGMYYVETTLGANVTNSSAGAVGPFQFLPSTASSYGYPLTNTPNISEYLKQAEAAAHLLKSDYDALGHDWTKALAAYNAGVQGYRNGLGYAANALGAWNSIPAKWKAAVGGDPSLPGGTANLGGTGTLLNDSGTSGAFTVGDATNPDEDYWTAINRLAQDRYWYFFSDGETAYLADGPDLMKQTPAAEIDRIEDAGNIHSMELVWDNTAWLYASTHRKRRRAQRRTTLAKITSPVEAQIQWICSIDEVRAGDVFTLHNCGPGDGQWLVGNVRRSVFDVSSEVNLVVALTPFSEGQLNPAGVNTKNSGTGSSSNNPLLPVGAPSSQGYFNPVGNWSPSRVDMGVDGTLKGPYVAPGDSQILITFQSSGTGSWRGWYMAGRLLSGPYKGKCWYVAEGIVPLVNQGATVKGGTPVARPVPSGFNGITGNIETGWANPSSPGNTLATVTGGYKEGENTAAGQSFNRWLKALGAAQGSNSGPVVGNLSAGYP